MRFETTKNGLLIPLRSLSLEIQTVQFETGHDVIHLYFSDQASVYAGSGGCKLENLIRYHGGYVCVTNRAAV